MDFWYFSSIQPWNNPVSNLINTQNPLHCVYLLCKHCFRDTWIHFECSLDGAVSLYLIHVTLEVPQHANRSIREQNKQNKKTPQTYFYSIYLSIYFYIYIVLYFILYTHQSTKGKSLYVKAYLADGWYKDLVLRKAVSLCSHFIYLCYK